MIWYNYSIERDFLKDLTGDEIKGNRRKGFIFQAHWKYARYARITLHWVKCFAWFINTWNKILIFYNHFPHCFPFFVIVLFLHMDKHREFLPLFKMAKCVKIHYKKINKTNTQLHEKLWKNETKSLHTSPKNVNSFIVYSHVVLSCITKE